MAKVAAMPIFGQNLKTFFGTRSSMTLKLGIDHHHRGLNIYKGYINDDPGLTTFYGKVKFCQKSLLILYQANNQKSVYRIICPLWFNKVLYSIISKCVEFFVAVLESCPNGFVSHQNSCYLFSHETATWADAVVRLSLK